MGEMAGVVVSPGRPAVFGSAPAGVPLASAARRPGPLQLLPCGFSRCSTDQSEKPIQVPLRTVLREEAQRF